MELAEELRAILNGLCASGGIEIRESGRRTTPSRPISGEVRGCSDKPLLHLWAENCNRVSLSGRGKLARRAGSRAAVNFAAGRGFLLLSRRLPSAGFTVKFLCPSAGRVPVNFSVSVRQADGVSLVDVTGRLTSFETRAFREMIQELLNHGHTNIVLNLTCLEYLDSSGIGELVRNYMSVIKQGGAVKVVGLAPKVEEILKVTQLYQVFPEFPDEASALESFSLRNPTTV